ncbi:MAG: hypothetical protein ACI8WT_002973 [Clostridium sp.]|jgi:hypothetical protein
MFLSIFIPFVEVFSWVWSGILAGVLREGKGGVTIEKANRVRLRLAFVAELYFNFVRTLFWE